MIHFVTVLTERYRSRSGKHGPVPEGRPGFWALLAAWGPCGLSPIAPGTVGTLGAVPLGWVVSLLPVPAQAAFLAGFLWLSVAAAARAGRHWKVVDASQIVIDEVMGFLVTMAFVPFTWPAAVAGFLLFRLFDVLKPWPASYFDSVKSGFGVVMDDVAAGAWAGVLLLALRHLAPGVLAWA